MLNVIVDKLTKRAERRIRRLNCEINVTEDGLIRVASDVIETVLMKNKDYGDAWQRQGMVGPLIRLADKCYRVETLSDGRDVLVVDENVEDTLVDLIGYGFLALLYLREKKSG